MISPVTPPRRRRRKLLLLVLLACLAGLGAFVALVFQDELPPDDSDLALERRAVPAEQNGFLLLDFSSDDIYWPDDEELVLAGSADFDVDAAREVVERNAAILEKLEACLARPEFLVGDDLEQVPYLLTWRLLAFVAACRSEYHCETGRPAEGLREAVRLADFGRRCQESQGPVITYLVGVAVHSIGVEAARRSLRHAGIQADSIRACLEELARARPRTAALQDALLAEYSWFKLASRSFEAGEDVGWGTDGLPRFRPFYYPQRTRRFYLEDLQTIVRNVGQLPGDRATLAVEARGVASWLNPVRLLNLTGRTILEESLPMLARAIGEKDKLAAQHAALEALLALRGHRLETGQLPATLAELVPRYLKAVPLDPYDGKPLRYSRDKRIVYSVGEDLKDAGGAEDTEDEKACENWDEPTFEVES